MDLIKVAEALVEKIKRDYPDDIAIVALCGSYIYHDTHDRSDLDFYFIPKTDRGYEMAQCFILDNIGFDFWGMSWERAESLANYNETNTSIITDAQVIYSASQEDLDRFYGLRDTGRKPGGEAFMEKAKSQLSICRECYFTMLEAKDNFSVVKGNAMWVLYFASFVTTLINQSCVKRGGRNLLREIVAMELVPEDFEALFHRIVLSEDIEEIDDAARQVIVNTGSLLRKVSEPPNSRLSDRAAGFYEEFRSIYNKLIHECETKNPQGVMLAIARVDYEIAHLLEGTGYDVQEFPNLFEASRGMDMNELLDAVRRHEALLVSMLEREGIPIVRYASMEEFREHLK